MSRRRKRRPVQAGYAPKVEGSAADWTEIRNLSADVLEVNTCYQRPVSRKRVAKIVANFDPDLVNVLKVSYRDGHYWVFDGQHTLASLRIKLGEHCSVACKIYYGLTLEDEARLFAKQFGEAQQLAAAYKIRAEAIGGDEGVRDFLQITRDAGFIIDPVKRRSGKACIQAVCKAASCYKELGEDEYKRMLNILMSAWGGETWSISQNMLGGMTLFLQTFGKVIDDVVLIGKLRGVNENQFLRKASMYNENSSKVAYASALAFFYNYRMKEENKLQILRLIVK